MMPEPVSEKDYRSRWDAETLAQAKEIEADPNRLNRAVTAAQKMAEDDAKKANHMRQVAGQKTKGIKKAATSNIPKGTGQEQTDTKGYNVFQRI